MRSILFFLSLFLFHFTLYSQNIPADTGFSNIAEAKNLKVNGLKEGKWVQYFGDKNGQPVETSRKHATAYSLAIYKAGKSQWSRQYYMDGHIMTETIHSFGKKDFVWRFYYESGKVMRDIPLSCKECPSKWFYENGNLKGKETRLDSTTTLEINYDIKGNLIQTDTMHGRNESGIIRLYYPNGKVKSEFPYVNDPANKLQKISFDSATLQTYQSKKFRKAAHTIYGYVKTGVWKSFYEDGAIKSEMLFVNGQITMDKSYFENGVVCSETPFEKGMVNGTMNEYYANGKLKSESPFVNGQLNGVVKEFDENGKLKKEITYKNNNVSGVANHNGTEK